MNVPKTYKQNTKTTGTLDRGPKILDTFNRKPEAPLKLSVQVQETAQMFNRSLKASKTLNRDVTVVETFDRESLR